MVIVRGKTKNLLDKAKESCLLAVDVYNKPKTAFRSGAYIVLMCIAWTSLFHAIFQKEGIKYYYRDRKNPRLYEKIYGEPKSWELSKCVKYYFESKSIDDTGTRENIKFFIPLRNKIEHQFMPDLDNLIFGECQSFLNNFERVLVEEFGKKHSINESLVYSLQFSKTHTKENKPSKDFLRIKEHIMKYREELPPEIISDPNYRFQAILIQTTNPNKADYSITFVHQDKLKPEQMKGLNQAIGIITEKLTPVSNLGKLRAKDVVKEVQKKLRVKFGVKIKFGSYHHNKCCMEYKIRPEKGSNNKRMTKMDFCIYDEAFDDFTYTKNWIKFLLKNLNKEEFVRLFPNQMKEIFGLLNSTEVSNKVKQKLNKKYSSKIKFGSNNHLKCCSYYNIRPSSTQPDNINEDFCVSDGNRYLYTPKWVDFLISNLSNESEFLKIFPNQANLLNKRNNPINSQSFNFDEFL